MSDSLDQAVHHIRVRRAEITEARKRLEIEDRELATAERVLVRLGEEPPVLGEGPAADTVTPPQPEFPAVVNVPLRWKPEQARKLPPTVMPREGKEPQRNMVAGISLEPISQAQADIFRALVGLRNAKGAAWLSYGRIDEVSGRQGSAGQLHHLEKKGYVKNFGEPGAPEWWPVAEGKLRIRKPNFAQVGEVDRVEPVDETPLADSEEQGGGLAAAMEAADDVAAAEAALAEPGERVTLGEVRSHVIDAEHLTADTAHPDDDDEVDIDDLAKSLREVLCVIAELSEDGGMVNESAILDLAEIDRGRLEGVLTRLSLLHAIEKEGRGWVPTRLGKRLAAEIKVDEGG